MNGPCWISPATPSQLYPTKRHNRRAQGLHRIVWEKHNGPIPEGGWILHHCDNMRCIAPDHLYLGDHDQNMKDMVSRGRHRNQVKNTLSAGSRVHAREHLPPQEWVAGVPYLCTGQEPGVERLPPRVVESGVRVDDRPR